jgi:hypothetical protein
MTGYFTNNRSTPMDTTPPPYNEPDFGDPIAVPSGPGPKGRTVRTAVQVLLAVLLAVPAALGALTAAGVEVPAGSAAVAVGVTGALVVLISAGQNAYDQHRGVG